MINRKNAFARVGALGWALALSRLIYKEAKNNALSKKEAFERNISGNIAQAYDVNNRRIFFLCILVIKRTYYASCRKGNSLSKFYILTIPINFSLDAKFSSVFCFSRVKLL